MLCVEPDKLAVCVTPLIVAFMLARVADFRAVKVVNLNSTVELFWMIFESSEVIASVAAFVS